MATEHVRRLEELRELMVQQRRQLATDLATPQERGGAQDLREMFLKVQMTIEAIDRALSDEQMGSEGRAR
jgi:hypothetical protein